jgi:hypothetical protein
MTQAGSPVGPGEIHAAAQVVVTRRWVLISDGEDDAAVPEWKRTAAKRLAWLFVLMPVEKPRAVHDIVEAGEGVDAMVARIAEQLLAGPMGDEEWRKTVRVLDAHTDEQMTQALRAHLDA